MLIEILVFPGVDEIDALGPLEVLRNASIGGAELQTRLVSLRDESEITGAHGLRFRPDGLLGSSGRPDVLIVPGGGWANRAPQGAWCEAQSGAIPRAVAGFYRNGATLASVCTGAMLLAAAGLLRGRHAITHHTALDDLRSAGVEIVNARVVDDGDIITSGGVTSGLDLGLYLVERFAGAEAARKIEKRMEYERRGEIWTGTSRAASAKVEP
jgi:transcriptional regulator GlxA family with amidase domain